MPGWAINDASVDDRTVLDRCEGNWADGPGGRGAGHNLGLSSSPDKPGFGWAEEIEGFLSPAQASDAMDRLIANLASCTAKSWGTQPIGQTRAVLAFTDAGVLWIQHKNAHVATLYVPTTDGPPPLAVQIEVADLITPGSGTPGGSEGRSSLAGPPTASPEPSVGGSVAAGIENYQALRKTLTSVPGWAITDGALRGPLTVLHRCGGAWADGRSGVGSDNNIGPFIPPGGLPVQWDEKNFGIPAGAPEAMDRLIGNLASCTAESWRTQPIGQTGAVLAFTDARVVWILQKNSHISMLHVPTTDGPPPLAAQVEVADQMYSWID